MRTPPMLLAGLAALLMAPGPAAALIPHTDHHEYDDLGDDVPVGTLYPGYTYDRDVVVECHRMMSCAAIDEEDGVVRIEVDLLRAFTRVTGWCAVPEPGQTIGIEVTDLLGEVTRENCAGAGGGTFTIASSVPGMRLVFRGDPEGFLVDHLAFSA